jgi:hypothetical protein
MGSGGQAEHRRRSSASITAQRVAGSTRGKPGR